MLESTVTDPILTVRQEIEIMSFEVARKRAWGESALVWQDHVCLIEAKTPPASSFQGTHSWRSFYAQGPGGDKKELGYDSENAEHGDKAVRSCGLSAWSTSHPTHCQLDIVRIAAVSTVVSDWEATWGMHESIKILWKQMGHFKQEMVWALTYAGRLKIELWYRTFIWSNLRQEMIKLGLDLFYKMRKLWYTGRDDT